MRAKYFTANNREAAEAKALAYFECGAGELTIDVISGGEEGSESLNILAIKGTPEHIKQMDAFFTLYYENDGVYLEIYAERGRGAQLESGDVLKHLGRKRLTSLSLSAAQELIEKGEGRAKIAPGQSEYVYGEELSVTVSKDELEASARLLPPEPNATMLTLEAAKTKLLEAGVTHGVDDSALTALIEEKDYGEPQVVARATPPEDGVEGKLVFNFSTDERTGSPREIGGGRVDYYSLDLYVPVTEGQLLVTRTVATEGQPGTTVKGNIIKQKPGKEITMPRCKNAEVNPDKTEMHAACSGMVDFVNNSVNVSSVYKVDGDCDVSVGSIDFDGSVHVSGSVRSGYTIKATNGITVGGGIEAATLMAGGNVEVKGGMQGSGKGKIEAGGSVSIMFLERGTIIADGPVKVDVSIHSKIETGSTIHALGKRGAIIGGHAGAAGDIIASYIGALSSTKTEIEVGFLPRKRARIAALEKEMERLEADRIKLVQLDAYLEKTKGAKDQEIWDKLFNSGVENKRINEENIKATTTEIDNLKYEMEHATESRVHVFETAFSGSRIVIGSSTYKVIDDISFATFKFSDGEVVYRPCEVSKSDIK